MHPAPAPFSCCPRSGSWYFDFKVPLLDSELRDDLRWRQTLRAKSAQTQTIVPLCQPHTFFVSHQVAMRPRWDRESERLIGQDLPRRAFQQVASADDLRDLHRVVINYTRQLISRNIVAPPDQKIREVFSAD